MNSIQVNKIGSHMTIDVTTGLINGSSQWICTGAVVINNFGNVSKRLTLKELAHALQQNPASMFYKNGKARFSITDIDHGTPRTQMSPAVYRHNVTVE